MNLKERSLLQALLDLLSDLPEERHAQLLDAAVERMASLGLLRKQRGFLRKLQTLDHKRRGVIPAVLTVPQEKGTEELLMSLQKLGKPLDLSVRTDPSLIGGAVLRLGDERFEFSLRRMVDELAAMIASDLLSASSS